jgi:hypothetical protein
MSIRHLFRHWLRQYCSSTVPFPDNHVGSLFYYVVSSSFYYQCDQKIDSNLSFRVKLVQLYGEYGLRLHWATTVQCSKICIEDYSPGSTRTVVLQYSFNEGMEYRSFLLSVVPVYQYIVVYSLYSTQYNSTTAFL